MDVLRTKHLRVNQLPPAELKELKISAGSPAAPPCVLTSLHRSLAGPRKPARRNSIEQKCWQAGRVNMTWSLCTSQCRQRICLEPNMRSEQAGLSVTLVFSSLLVKSKSNYAKTYKVIMAHDKPRIEPSYREVASNWSSPVSAWCHRVVQSQSGLFDGGQW